MGAMTAQVWSQASGSDGGAETTAEGCSHGWRRRDDAEPYLFKRRSNKTPKTEPALAD